MQTLVCEQLCLCALLMNGLVVVVEEETGMFRLLFSFRTCIQDKRIEEKDDEKQLGGESCESMCQSNSIEQVNNMLNWIQALLHTRTIIRQS
jgi:hypothetical protein